MNLAGTVLIVWFVLQPHRPPRPQFDGGAFPPRFDLHPEGDF